jgi:hypothetical protein
MHGFMDVDSFVSCAVDFCLRCAGVVLSKQETAACLLRLAVSRLRACGETDESIESLFDCVAYGDPVDVARSVADMLGGHVALVIVPGAGAPPSGPARLLG